ncbi:hypothetical protein BDY21DRAFT_374741 [Lineolata rhizophorae]|uniref:Transmembrane protein n=1 Tax=Lineolata rhizophorae TaxID=578093 RepID=A0A6A6NPG6_9PEZI|nr:hypothetical protein BDY21DRAFT_374741 [Lineolata rhizophorae]
MRFTGAHAKRSVHHVRTATRYPRQAPAEDTDSGEDSDSDEEDGVESDDSDDSDDEMDASEMLGLEPSVMPNAADSLVTNGDDSVTFTLAPSAAATTSPDNANPFNLQTPAATNAPTTPMPNRGGGGGGEEGLSQGTQHLLIAAGSIGGTILILFIIMFIVRARTGASYGDLLRFRVPRRKQDMEPGPGWNNNPVPSYEWGGRSSPDSKEPSVTRSRKTWLPPPRPAPARGTMFGAPSTVGPDSSVSQQPPRTVTSVSRRADRPTADENPVMRSFLEEKTPTKPQAQAPWQQPLEHPNHQQGASISSTGREPSVAEDQLIDDYNKSTMTPLDTASGPQQRPESVLPPPPALGSAASGRPQLRSFFLGGLPTPTPKISRFSWTNSQAPTTPHQAPAAAAAAAADGQRYSVATSRSSVARYRTVDSWVNHQANRLEEQRLRDELATPTTAGGMPRGGPPEPVPDVPDRYRESAGVVAGQASGGSAAGPATEVDGGAQEGSTAGVHKHTPSDASVFRQHPGTEVVIQQQRLIPSDVLDSGVKPAL